MDRECPNTGQQCVAASFCGSTEYREGGRPVACQRTANPVVVKEEKEAKGKGS